MVGLLCKTDNGQKNLEQRLVNAIARNVCTYFEKGGVGLREVDLSSILKSGLKQGVVKFSGDNVELAAAMLDVSPGYLQSVNYLKINGEKRKAAVLVRKGLKIGASEKDKQAQKIELAKKDLGLMNVSGEINNDAVK